MSEENKEPEKISVFERRGQEKAMKGRGKINLISRE